MNLRQEVLSHREKIRAAQGRERREQREHRQVFYEIPPANFYSPRQLDQYQEADRIITDTTQKVLEEIVGKGEYDLVREFRPRYSLLSEPKEMRYVISLGTEGVEGRDERINLFYRPSGFLVRESLTTRGVTVLEHQRTGRVWQEACNVRTTLRLPNPRHLSTAIVGVPVITEHHVEDLLVVALSNPKIPLRTSVLT